MKMDSPSGTASVNDIAMSKPFFGQNSVFVRDCDDCRVVHDVRI